MKFGIYSPYLDTAGGGEKYILTIAEILSQEEEVEVLMDQHLFSIGSDVIKKKNETRHNLNLARVNFIKAPIGKGSSVFERLFFLRRYDFLFFLTNGSFFFSSAKKSIIHFQVPFSFQQNVWNKLKLLSWQYAIYNSKFTKDIVEQTWPISGEVVYPPVSINLFKPLNKKNQIISVGRFFGFLKDKKHSLLIESFKDLVDKDKIDWSLHLVGGATEGDWKYIEELRKQSVGYKIYFHPNASFDQLKKLYGESKIYWHAAGFGEEDPKKYEHFGITTVEAMAAGCVPVVINKGGQREIIDEAVNGFKWDNKDRLLKKTLELMKDSNLIKKLTKNGINKSRIFSKENFKKKIVNLVQTT